MGHELSLFRATCVARHRCGDFDKDTEVCTVGVRVVMRVLVSRSMRLWHRCQVNLSCKYQPTGLLLPCSKAELPSLLTLHCEQPGQVERLYGHQLLHSREHTKRCVTVWAPSLSSTGTAFGFRDRLHSTTGAKALISELLSRGPDSLAPTLEAGADRITAIVSCACSSDASRTTTQYPKAAAFGLVPAHCIDFVQQHLAAGTLSRTDLTSPNSGKSKLANHRTLRRQRLQHIGAEVRLEAMLYIFCIYGPLQSRDVQGLTAPCRQRPPAGRAR